MSGSRAALDPVTGDGLRFAIRLDGEYAGGITVHSVCGGTFSYGVAVAPSLALHEKLGFARTAQKDGVVTMEKSL